MEWLLKKQNRKASPFAAFCDKRKPGYSHEPISKCPILFEVKEGENFDHRDIMDISRIGFFV